MKGMGPNHNRTMGSVRPRNMGKTFVRLLGYLKPFRLSITIVLICLVLQVVGSVGATYLLTPFLDGLDTGNYVFMGIQFGGCRRVFVCYGVRYCWNVSDDDNYKLCCQQTARHHFGQGNVQHA